MSAGRTLSGDRRASQAGFVRFERTAKPAGPVGSASSYLVSEVPGFGGIYFDKDGELTILLKDTTKLDTAKPHIKDFMLRGKRQTSRLRDKVSRATSHMKVRRAKYDFRDLNSWHRIFVARKALGVPGTVLTAIDHRANRIVVGVSGRDKVGPMRKLLAKLPVPPDAVAVIEVGEIQPANRRIAPSPFVDSTLADHFNPVPGGVQLASLQGGVIVGCTLGFNLVRWTGTSTTDTSRFFVTASHCTPNQGTFDASFNMYHPTLNSKSSTEILDPPFFTSESTLPDFQNYCPDGRICSFADAVLMKWDVASGVQQGQVAAAGLNTTTVNGRYTVDDVEDLTKGRLFKRREPSPEGRVARSYILAPWRRITLATKPYSAKASPITAMPTGIRAVLSLS